MLRMMITYLVLAAATASLSSGSDAFPPPRPAFAQGPVLPKDIPVELIAEPLQKRLSTNIEKLEHYEASHISETQALEDESQVNADFTRKFRQEGERYAFDQYIQDARLDLLEAWITELEALKERVDELSQTASDINDALNESCYPIRRLMRSYIYTLGNEDKDINKRIAETRVPEQRVDELFDKIYDNEGPLRHLDSANDRLSRAANAHLGSTRTQIVLPNYPKFASNYTVFPPYLVRPQGHSDGLVGFRAVKNPGKDSYGFSSIYTGVFSQLDTEGAVVHGVDMSSGGWTVNALRISSGEIVFSGAVPGLKD